MIKPMIKPEKIISEDKHYCSAYFYQKLKQYRHPTTDEVDEAFRFAMRNARREVEDYIRKNS